MFVRVCVCFVDWQIKHHLHHLANMPCFSSRASQIRYVGLIYSFTLVNAAVFAMGFSADTTKDAAQNEQYHRMVSIFSKNKYGYNTRFMSEFEVFLEAMLNERFLDESVAYYQDEQTTPEIEDTEAGLAGDFAPHDVKELLKDYEEHDHSSYKSVRFPDRVGTNYPKGDALSCYKILPKQ